jgi:hypothetical protein
MPENLNKLHYLCTLTGKVRHIGLTGYSLDVLMRAVQLAPPGTIDTVLTYCRS